MLVRAAQRASYRRLSSFQSEAIRTRDVVRPSRLAAVTSRSFSSSSLDLNPVSSPRISENVDSKSIASERHYNTAASLSEPPPDLSFVYPAPKVSRVHPAFNEQPKRVYDASKLLSGAVEKPDLSSLIILSTPELPVTEPGSMKKPYDPFNLGVSTRKEDLSSTFMACIKAGKLYRAEVTLIKMMELDALSENDDKAKAVGFEEDIIDMHNAYLVALLDNMKALPEIERKPILDKINKWRAECMKGLKDNAKTYAILMELVYHENQDQRLKKERKWKQYISAWRAANMGPLGDVFRQTVLTPQTLQEIFQTCIISRDEIREEQLPLFDENALKEPNPRLQVPEVAATKVQGHGLEAVKQSLRSFTDPDFIPSALIFESPDEGKKYNEERQKMLEQDAYEAAIERWQAEHAALQETGVVSLNPGVKPLLWQWHQAMVPLIREEFTRINEALEKPDVKRNEQRARYGPYLQVLPAEKLAAITIMTLVRSIATGDVSLGIKTAAGVISVGKAVEFENLSEELKKQEDAAAQKGARVDRQLLSSVKTQRDLMQYMRRKRLNSDTEPERQNVLDQASWSQEIRANVGSVLTSLLLHCAKVNVKLPTTDPGLSQRSIPQPAFFHTYQYMLGKRVGVIRVHLTLVEMLGSENLDGALISKQLPMLVEPLPWEAWNNGAYYFTPSRVMRYKESLEQALYCKEASARGDLTQVFAGLDVLGSTQWCINQKVFNTVLKVWNSGEKFADIPAAMKDDDEVPDPPLTSDIAARTKYIREVKAAATQKQNNHSQRCDVNFKMEIARAFFHEKFYFPHNIDFRGRAYPVPPHLNHMGNDLCRGLLKFGHSKPLGKNGLRWLKIHLANLCGFDKASLSDREQYATQHLEEIYDSARNPLDGKRWWLKSEDPWQCLAACIEVEAALNSPDPLEYECNLAVHQDGTCNGLQHYAALGGDMAGAKEVNLEPSDKPQDVYTGVAELVKESVRKDIEDGVAVASQILPYITRKVVKQTVMTNVYGVTFVGARAQVTNRLKEIEAINPDEIPKIAMYLTKKIFLSLNKMFTGAHHIQTWFGECARRISKSIGPSQFPNLKLHSNGEIPVKNKKDHLKARGKIEFMSSVVWTTPLKLPVVQPYRNATSMIVKTNLQTISITDPTIISQVNHRKQMSAFPPNFIHSLDASHMLLCALRCRDAGLQFAAVHDSFWTHPSDVDNMNLMLRDAFIEMHSADIVGNLREEFQTRYTGYKTLLTIPEGDPLAKEVIKLRKRLLKEYTEQTGKKKTSFTAVEELEREVLRDTLCASSNEEERARGEAMITPGTLVEKYGKGLDQDVEFLSTQGLGDIKPSSTTAVTASTSSETTVQKRKKFKVTEDDMTDVMGDVDAVPKIESIITVDEPVAGDDEMMADAEDFDVEDVHDDPDTSKVEKEESKGTKNGKGRSLADNKRVVLAWVPLVFPSVPEKGEFDVSRLKQSQYFFS